MSYQKKSRQSPLAHHTLFLHLWTFLIVIQLIEKKRVFLSFIMQPFICLLFVSLQAAKLPMSIIIVGVGQAEFDGTVKFFIFQTET